MVLIGCFHLQMEILVNGIQDMSQKVINWRVLIRFRGLECFSKYVNMPHICQASASNYLFYHCFSSWGTWSTVQCMSILTSEFLGDCSDKTWRSMHRSMFNKIAQYLIFYVFPWCHKCVTIMMSAPCWCTIVTILRDILK